MGSCYVRLPASGLRAALLLAAPALLSAFPQDAAPARDPAPPKLEPRESKPPPAPRPHPKVRLHGAPGPLAEDAVTGDWIDFPGPGGEPVSPETHLLKEWGAEGPRLVWELEAGRGYSSPAIQGERLLYFHRVGDEERVECLHPESGALYWRFAYPTDYRDSYGYSDGPRASPVIDGERVYTYGAQGRLHCLELATGQPIWRRALSDEFDVPQDFFGVVSTPVVHGELLIVHVGAPGGPCVIALDKLTGALRWTAGERWTAGYSTPRIGNVHGRPRCFVFAGGKSRPPHGGLLALDPDTGEIDFRFPWRSRSYESVNASVPVLVGDQVFISASYDTGGALLDLKPEGGYEVAWTSMALGTHFNTAVHKDGYLYGFDGRNEPDASLVCLELAGGKEMWRTVLEWDETYELHGRTKPRPMSVYRGMLLAVDGDFLCLGERGHLLWLELTPRGHRELARSWLFAAHETWTPPVLSRGLLYICQNARDFVRGGPPRLLCYDLRAGGGEQPSVK